MLFLDNEGNLNAARNFKHYKINRMQNVGNWLKSSWVMIV
jgi:hypothetical protein